MLYASLRHWRWHSPPTPTLRRFVNHTGYARHTSSFLAGQELVGSIGVSGAPGGDKDAVCAQTGIDRIAKGLGG